ncbi:hypothetical protein [Microbacterium sp. LWH10-1.2]|uniref:hypothetical protein n=1 Tax=Microbacterium sp. LWH10-1.2 TaxID=3135255 RepID=UPI0031391C7C
MGRLVAQASPTILVLTHDDHDHIGGWEGFTEAGLDTLDELWIPYEWDVVARAAEALAQGAILVSKLPESSLPELEESLRSGYSAVVSDARNPTDAPGDAMLEAVDLSAALSDAQKDELSVSVQRYVRLLAEDSEDLDEFFDGTAAEIGRRAASKAGALQKLMVDAYQNRVEVRLFSVDHGRSSTPWWSAGRPGVATLANAVEVRRRAAASSSLPLLSFALALSVQNRRALCPVLWHAGKLEGGAIVWSDSSGSWVTSNARTELLPKLHISTAPHHASASPDHDPAWEALSSFLTRAEPVMLSAGGQWNQQVRKEYASLAPSRKRCTRCRCEVRSPESQTIVLHTDERRAGFARGERCREP